MTRYFPQRRSKSVQEPEFDQRVPLVDVVTDKCIGYLSSENLNIRVRRGRSFYQSGRVWEILHVGEDETLFVLPFNESESSSGRRILQIRPLGVSFDLAQEIGRMNLPRGAKSVEKFLSQQADQLAKRHHTRKIVVEGILEKLQANMRLGFPTPTSQRMILEYFENYMVLHALLGDPVNSTLSLIFDAILTEQDLLRDIYSDGFRISITIQFKPSEEELEAITRDLFKLASNEINHYIQSSIEARFPSLASDKRNRLRADPTGASRREEFVEGLDVRGVKAIYEAIAEGKMQIKQYFAYHRATPLASNIIEEHTKQLSEENRLLIQNNTLRLKRSLEKEVVELLCLTCLTGQQPVMIRDLKDRPECRRCSSRLLSLSDIHDYTVQSLLRRKSSGEPLTRIETTKLANARRTADLVLSYGKKGVVALTVMGIGPETASRILASMHDEEQSFYRDVLQAKIHFLQTRGLWHEKRSHSSL